MKNRLPLSLLFACAFVPVVAPAATSLTETATPTTVYSDPLLSKQWQWFPSKNGVNIAPLWADGITGTGVVIGIIDAWVEPNHEDLNVSPYYGTTAPYSTTGLSRDFVGTEKISSDGTQIYTTDSHGTFVAGMAAAIGGNGKGVVGAAPGATIAGLHAGTGTGITVSYAKDAAYWASGVSEDGKWNGDAQIAVKNCSFGSGFSTSADFLKSIELTTKNNVIYVFAAGNSRKAASGYMPSNTGWSSDGNSTSIINVAATKTGGTYADFSCYGSNIFISAPGQAVVSTDRTGTLGYNTKTSLSTDTDSDSSSLIRNNNYASSDGTSFASPLVAGVVALGKQVCSMMDTRWAKHALAYSSGHGTAPNIDCVYDSEKQTYVQKSGYTITTTDEDGNKTTTTVNSTGDWQKNNGGYWFNNNYGFGLVDPVGFVDKVRDIAYTTVETTAKIENFETQSTSDTVKDGVRNIGVTYGFVSSKTETSTVGSTSVKKTLITQPVETISVTLDLTNEDGTSVDFTDSLKVTLIAPDGKESVLVQPGKQPSENMAAALKKAGTTSWTFETNAFWGSTYSKDYDKWQVKLEYEGTSGAKLLTVSAVNFTMGTFVNESSSGGVRSAEVNAHALALDDKDSVFTVYGTGKLFVEEGVLINGGSFVVQNGGEVRFYSDSSTLGGKTGAIFIQNGGSSTFAGTADFARGLYLNGGNASFSGGSVSAGSVGVVVNGAAVSLTQTGVGTNVSGFDITLNGGSVSLNNGVSFNGGITQNGGTLTASTGAKGITLTMKGGTATLNNRVEFSGAIKVGASETTTTDGVESSTLYGGTLNVSGAKVTARGGIAIAGTGAAYVAANTRLDTQKTSSSASNTYAGVTLADFGYFEMGKEAVLVGALQLTGGNAYLKGGNSIHGAPITGGTFAAAGTLSAGDISVSAGGIFRPVGETVLVRNAGAPVSSSGDDSTTSTRSKMTFGDGATLNFEARSRTDYDVLVIGNGQSLVFGNGSSGGTVKFNYSFGNVLPFAIDIIKTTYEEEYKTDDYGNIVHDGDGNPVMVKIEKISGWNDVDKVVPEIGGVQVYNDDFTLSALTLGVSFDEDAGTISLGADVGGESEIQAHRLYYSYQTPRQSAVQRTLIKNEKVVTTVASHTGTSSPTSGATLAAASTSTATVSGIAAPVVDELDKMSYVSELLAAYDKLGTPSNLVAIDELHDKQASAITGALSRRSRELRSGFIHSDTWSNPLFGNSGFTFSANPSLVAAKGFVPYYIPEDDYPLMIWMNGGYSSSGTDAESAALSSTKSSMLNVFMGADYAVSREFAVGIFAGYTNGRTKFDGGGRTEVQSRNLGIYLAGARTSYIGSFYYSVLAAFGAEEYDFTRKITIGSLDANSKASPDGWQGIVALEGGYEWKLDKFSMGPNLTLRYVSNNIDGYTESSSAEWAKQETGDVSYDSLQGSFGFRIAYRADFETVSLLPELRIAWNHEFIGTDESFDTKLAMPGAETYSSKINSTGDDFATVGAGLTVMLGEVSTISFDYDMQFLRDDADPVHTFNAILRTRF